MDFILNKNAKLKVGGRKAPKGTVQDLKNNLDNWSKKKGLEPIHKNYGISYDDYSEILYWILDNTKDFEYQCDFENRNSEKEDITNSGVPYIALYCGGDWETGMYVFLYWDGNDPRVYVPTKGNTVNTKSKHCLGNEYDYVLNLECDYSNPASSPRIIPVDYKTDPNFEICEFKYITDQLYEETGIDKRDLTEANLDYIYDKNNLNVISDFDLCLQDFESRIETI